MFTSAKRGSLVCFLPFIVAKILKLNFSGKGTDFILLRNDGIHRTVTSHLCMLSMWDLTISSVMTQLFLFCDN